MPDVIVSIHNAAGTAVAGPIKMSVDTGSVRDAPFAIQGIGLNPADGPFKLRVTAPTGVDVDVSDVAVHTVLTPA